MRSQDSNEESDGGLPPRAGSPSSLTRETDQLEECDQYKVDEDYAEYNAYRRMVEHARTLERERDEWRKKAVDLHARHKNALEDIEAEIQARNEARFSAVHWRDIAAGSFSQAAVLPWESLENDQGLATQPAKMKPE